MVLALVTLCDPWTNGLAPSSEVQLEIVDLSAPGIRSKTEDWSPGCKDLGVDWPRVLTDPEIVDHRLFRVFVASSISADRLVSAESSDLPWSDP